jgi:cytochrome c peroxidase
MQRPAFIVVLIALLAFACSKDEVSPTEGDTPYTVSLPAGAPPIPTPADNALTVARVTLGKKLFFDERLSLGNGLSCASCHLPARAFSDTVALSVGHNGALGFRNAPTLANVAYHSSFFRDGGVTTLEMQVLAPLHDDAEMASNVVEVCAQLKSVEPFASLSWKAYGRELDPYVITRAIAAYERTLISGWSRFDRFAYGNDANALTESEQRGWQLFNSEALGCGGCHGGFDLSDHDFHNIGTTLDYSVDPGRERITLQASDRGKFKTPTLRNIALTGPYMHDGSMSTLEQVIDHFATGGIAQPNLDQALHAFVLSSQDKADLLAFLNSLTDERSIDQLP